MIAKVEENELEDFLYKPDTFGTIRAMGIEKYPGEMPIVRELLQNADDAEAVFVRFKINDDEIVIENNGRPFTKPDEVDRKEDSDFYRISHIGLGKTEEEMTGTFGIGFTVVFHLTDTPRIVSNGWDFQIRVNDYPILKKAPFNEVTRIHLPLRLQETDLSKRMGAEVFDSRKKESFERELLCEAYNDIFFLKKIERIEAYKRGRLFSVRKKVGKIETLKEGVTCEHIVVETLFFMEGRKKRHTERWLIYYLDGVEIPDYLLGLGQTLKQKVAIAIPDFFKGARIKRRFHTKNYAYFTLPVAPTGFNFKYNASKLFVTSGRSEFVTKEGLKREWNLWQMDNLAQLLAFIIDSFITKGMEPNIVYEFVPITSQVKHEMDSRIFNSFKRKVDSKEIRLFYTSANVWRGKEDIYWNWNGLAEVLPEESGRYLIHPKMRKYALTFESYGIHEIGLSEFGEYLESKYGTDAYKSGKTEDPDRIRKIFEYLGRQHIEPHLIEKLKRVCIVLTEKGILRSYNYRVFFRTDEAMPLINPDDIVHHQTYNTKIAEKFLKDKLKIKKMSLHDLIVDSFLPRLNHYDTEQKFEFMWYLAKRQRDVFRRKDTIQRLQEKLRELILVEHMNDPDGPVFFPDAELKDIFGDKLNYIGLKYEEQARKERVKWKKFFEKVGVKRTPDPDKVIGVVQEISLTGYAPENIRRANLLMKFLSTRWRKFYSKHAEDLKKLRNYAWIPTTRGIFSSPTEVYVNKALSKLVGESQNFLVIEKPKSKGVVKVLGLLTEPRLRDVINLILEKRGEEQGKNDRAVGFAIYAFLNKKVDFLGSDLLKVLTSNRTIWFKGRLWNPSKLFRENYQGEFGPNGWLRGYIQKHKLSRLTRLCSVLGIDRPIRTPDDYVDWLLDVADESEQAILTDWKVNLIRNAYFKLAQIVNAIPREQLEKLGSKKIMLSSKPGLRLPSECYMIRRGEEILCERIARAGMPVPIIEAERAELERLYLLLRVNDLSQSLVSQRADSSATAIDHGLTEKFQQMTQWLDGYEYSLTGSVSEYNTLFQQLKVFRVSKLEVLYSLNGLTGKPIEDISCLERINNSYVLYLDTKFSINDNDHLRLLSIQLIKILNPAIDRIIWSSTLPSLLVLGQIIGISPYDRELGQQKEAPDLILPRWKRRGLVEVEVRMPKEGVPRGIEMPIAISDERTFKPAEDLVKEAFMEKEPKKLEEVIYKPALNLTDPIESSPIATVKEDIEYRARLNLQPIQVNGELIHATPGIPIPPKEERDKLRTLLQRIVKVMGGNPDTVKLITAEETTNARLEQDQILCNASLKDTTPTFWIIVIARELARHYSRKRYAHTKAMSILIEKAIEHLHEIYPDLYEKIARARR